jgi:hypothetical protein
LDTEYVTAQCVIPTEFRVGHKTEINTCAALGATPTCIQSKFKTSLGRTVSLRPTLCTQCVPDKTGTYGEFMGGFGHTMNSRMAWTAVSSRLSWAKQ